MVMVTGTEESSLMKADGRPHLEGQVWARPAGGDVFGGWTVFGG